MQTVASNHRSCPLFLKYTGWVGREHLAPACKTDIIESSVSVWKVTATMAHWKRVGRSDGFSTSGDAHLDRRWTERAAGRSWPDVAYELIRLEPLRVKLEPLLANHKMIALVLYIRTRMLTTRSYFNG